MDRSGNYENCGHDDFFSWNDPCYCNRRYAWTKSSKWRYSDHSGKLDKIRPTGEKYGFEGQKKSLCGGCHCKWYQYFQNPLETHSAEYVDDHDSNGSSGYGNHDAGTGITFLPGFWSSCADTGMGTDAE